MGQSLVGLDCELSFSSTLVDDSSNTPEDLTWTEIDVVSDASLDLGHVEATLDTRGNNGVRTSSITLKEFSVSGTIEWAPDDSGFQELRDAYQNSTEVAIAALDGAADTTGSQGVAGNWVVTQFNRNENATEILTADFTLKPSSYPQYWIKA